MDKEFIARGVKRCSSREIPVMDFAVDRAAGLRPVSAPACAW